MTYAIDEILKAFDSVTLEEMSGIRLMNRMDTKFVTTVSKLRSLLEMAAAEYKVQQVNGGRNLPYYTLYYDTPGHDMYLAHQNGRAVRQKVRIRSYVDEGISFLEVKKKDNKGRTDKQRIPVGTLTLEGAEAIRFLHKQVRYAPECLSGQLENRFRRITLVNRSMTERLTIDTELSFHHVCNGNTVALDGLAVIELKKEGCSFSPVHELLRRLRIRPAGFSKYCMGTALTNHEMKQNRFKPRLRRLERLLREQDRTERKD